MQIIKEMALSRTDAMDRCLDLGKRFIEHFHKIYKEGIESPNFAHHCIEMQAWIDSCRVLKLKSTKRSISNSDLIDWFFTAGGGIDSDNGFNTQDEIDAYNDFFVTLAANKDYSVCDVANKILVQYTNKKSLQEELSKGIFWIVDTGNMSNNRRYCFTIPCNPDGIPDSYDGLNSKNGETYNHERYWKMLGKSYTHGEKYNYYPRGRVEISNGKATIFVNPNVATEELKQFIIGEFHLNPHNGIKKVVVCPDGSSHYKCYLDSEEYQ